MQEPELRAAAPMCQEAAEETAFQTLPVDLQQWVFARAGAPFNTGKAAAAVAKDASLLAVWLTASVQHPLLTASQLKAWDTCTALLSSSSSYLPSEYDLFHATVYASEAGQLELVHSLISRGAWQAWLWGETDAHLSLPVDDHYLNNSIWDRLKHITSAKEIDEARAVVRLRHPLVGAAANGHLEVCRLLLAKGVHARAARKALLAAAKYGHLPVVRLLLLEVPDTGTVPCVGCNPIEFAAEGGHLAVVQLLVQQGVDIEAAQWALCGAAREGHLEVVQYLVKALVAVSGQYAAQKALYCAAERNHLQVVQYLLEQGTPPLFSGGHAEVARVLRYTSALEAAAASGAEDVLQLLMSREGWFQQRAWENALTLSVMRGRAGAARLLLKAVGMPPPTFRTAKAASKQAVYVSGSFPFAKPDGADLSQIVRRVDASLVQSAVFGRTKVTEVLLDHGADVHADQGAALVGAASQGHTEVVCLLLSHGASKGRRGPQMSQALNAAIQGQYLDVVSLLVEHGAYVGVQEQQKLLKLGYDACELCASSPRRAPPMLLKLVSWWQGRKQD